MEFRRVLVRCVAHGDLVAAELAQLLGAELRHIAALVEDLAADDGAVVAEIAHDRHGDGRLAAARLAAQADALALVQGHVEVDHRREPAGARAVRSEERRVGEEGVSWCRSRWWA